MQASAAGYSQITLNLKQASLEKVVTSLKKQSGLMFLYNDDELQDIRISVQLKNVPLDQALATCFKDLPVTYKLVDNTVLIKKKELSLMDKVKTYLNIPVDIAGMVTDSLGNPLAGTIIKVRGSATQVLTGADGKFYLDNFQDGTVITVSYIGYATQTLTVGKEFVTVVMKPAVAALKEVTVLSTGYQVLSKERATGSFSKPDLEIYKNRTGTMDIIGRLEGLVAGLSITSSNNAEGETSKNPIIRGNSSVELTSSPLYVVNGVIVTSINDLNPNDIADITVLKDAAAAAIWGARAANGVIVITTLSGTTNQKINVNYSGFVNFGGKPDFGYNRLLNSKQYIEAARETFSPQLNQWDFLSNSVITPHEVILYNEYRGLISNAQANASLDSLSNINNTSQVKDLLYANALTTNQTFSVSGGSKAYSFYGSMSYTGTHSNHPGQKSNAYGLNFTQDINPAKYLRISLNTALKTTQSNAQRNINIQDKFLPYQLFRDEEGNNISMPYVQGWSDETRAGYQARSRINLDYNPLDELNYGYTKSNNLAVNLTGNAWLKLLPGLSFHGTYGYSKSPTTGKSYDDHQSYRLRRELLGLTEASSTSVDPVYYLPTTGGTYSLAQTEQRNYTLRNQLEYMFSGRNGNDQLNVQVGQEANEQYASFTNNRLYGYNEGLGTYTQINYAAISTITDPVDPEGGYFGGGNPYTESETKSRATAYFALGSYTFNRKYSLDASWRIDHSSLIGQDKSAQNRPIWSIGGKWLAAREGFMKNVSWVNDLALRATYGITGNSPLSGASSSYDILTVQQDSFGATYIGGNALMLSTPANRKLSWESTETLNIGIDFGVLNRISGSIDLYRKKTTDLLGQLTANPLTGYSSYLSNIGNLNNKGIELDIRSQNIIGRDFSWSTGFIFAYNKNKLVSYIAPTAYQNTGFGRLYSSNIEGYPINAVFAYRYAGLDHLGDPQIRLADGTVTKEQSVATAADLVYMGSRTPKFSGGLTNSFRYKSFGLSVNMVYNLGGVMNKEVNTFYTGRLTLQNRGSFIGNVPALFADRWKVAGDEAFTTIPSYVADSEESDSRRDVDYYQHADINVVSSSYAKIRDFTLSYTLSPRLLRKLKTQAISFNAQATNFMLWTANKDGLDPENQDLSSGTRYLPATKHTFSLGVNVTF
ncbi:SusC/RagA family TonB-linked outer membrane protein [Pedobacter sp. AW31-3R]|uniref:SusC/RagA family TonB-linked outer membrane protein n=1 Tax=Pedobacter sp. AW31-3R TaxID=3445781 RepID=UPI003F9ED97F